MRGIARVASLILKEQAGAQREGAFALDETHDLRDFDDFECPMRTSTQKRVRSPANPDERITSAGQP